jgi:hypothetical protein
MAVCKKCWYLIFLILYSFNIINHKAVILMAFDVGAYESSWKQPRCRTVATSLQWCEQKKGD